MMKVQQGQKGISHKEAGSMAAQEAVEKKVTAGEEMMKGPVPAHWRRLARLQSVAWDLSPALSAPPVQSLVGWLGLSRVREGEIL